MAQFDVHRNPDPRSARIAPYLLDVQSDLLDRLATRVVVPLIRDEAMKAAQRLNPIFAVEGLRVVMATADLAAIRRSDLGEFVASLEAQRTAIVGALDVLITGI